MSMAVLWITLLGAMIAVREQGHIRVDIMDRFLPPHWTRPALIVANICASSVCLVVAGYSIEFVWLEYTIPTTNGIGMIPLWILVSIFPIAFFVMGIRFALNIFLHSDE